MARYLMSGDDDDPKVTQLTGTPLRTVVSVPVENVDGEVIGEQLHTIHFHGCFWQRPDDEGEDQ